MPLDKTGDRVKNAERVCLPSLQKELKTLGINANGYEVFLQVYKAERVLEVWVKNKTDREWKQFTQFSFCKFSGKLGPKRKEGDFQIPEGFYYINRFNPNSNFYLSLGLNYPNGSDLILADKQQPGSDIFIHGGCETVGCIPINDENIAVLYLLTLNAFNQGQAKIPVHIYPTNLTNENLSLVSEEYPQHADFWGQLKVAYDFFEEHKELVEFEIDGLGMYLYL